MSKRNFVIIAVISFSGLFSSCISGIDSIQNSPDVDLTFCPSIVSLEQTTKTSDAGYDSAPVRMFKLKEESGPIFFDVQYSSQQIPVSSQSILSSYDTKGALKNVTGADGMLHDYVTTFKVASWNTETSDVYINPYNDVTYSNGEWALSEKYQINNNDNLIFYAYANSGSSDYFSLSCDKDGQNFSYTVPVDPAYQNDLIMGDYEGNTIPSGETLPTGKVPITFTHPLTSVVFKLGSIENIEYVKSISISGVYASGTVTHTSGLNFDWGSTKTGSTTVSQTKADGLVVNGTSGYIGVPFVLIPQNLSSQSVKFSIVVHTTAGSDVTLVASRSIDDWKAGTCNVYTIQEDAYSVDILGDLSSGVTFKNTSGTSVFIRVALAGNFYDAGGNIVAPWNGTITPGTGWELNSDGFYYYQSSIASDNATSSILTMPTPPSYDNATFHLDVLVQASHYPF